MASLKSREFRGYCDEMYKELSDMKSKLDGFVRVIEHMRGPEGDVLKPHISHFQDIARTIDWKLEILTKVCPFEWNGYANVEKTASVRVEEQPEKESIGAGYLGG